MDHPLLKTLAELEGYSDTMLLLEDNVFDSIVPGICEKCEATQDCEPDARENYCDHCGENSVKSCLVLAGVI